MLMKKRNRREDRNRMCNIIVVTISINIKKILSKIKLGFNIKYKIKSSQLES